MLDEIERAPEQLGAGGEGSAGRENEVGGQRKVDGEYRIGGKSEAGREGSEGRERGESEAGGEDRIGGENRVGDSGQADWCEATAEAVPAVNAGCSRGETEAGENRAVSGLNQFHSTQDNGVGQTPAHALRPKAEASPYPHFVCGGSVSEKLQKLAAAMPSAEILGDLADLYKNFGDSTRLSILSALRVSELCVSDLAELLSMTPSAISHQLRSLRDHNLIRYRREGKTVMYSLADEHVELMIDMGLEHLMELE